MTRFAILAIIAILVSSCSPTQPAPHRSLPNRPPSQPQLPSTHGNITRPDCCPNRDSCHRNRGGLRLDPSSAFADIPNQKPSRSSFWVRPTIPMRSVTTDVSTYDWSTVHLFLQQTEPNRLELGMAISAKYEID